VLTTFSPELRDALLAFYFERDDSLPFEQAVPEFLRFVQRWLPGETVLSVCVPAVLGWRALTSEGETYSSVTACAAEWGQPAGWVCVGREAITFPGQRQAGWLAVFCPTPDDQAEIAQGLPVWRKVAQQMVNRHAFQELHQSYSALVDAAVDAIITIDAKGTVLEFNPGATRMFGYEAAEVIGTSINQLMPPPYSVEHDGYLHNYMSTGVKRIIGIGRRVPGRRKDGSIFPAHLAVTEFQRGGASYFIGTLRDLSDFVEARSRASVEERKHLSRELHDSVSQALFGIVLGTQAIKNSLGKGEPAGEAVDYVLHLAEAALLEMRTLIFELRPESLESEGLLASLSKQTQALAKRYKISVTLEGHGEEPRLDLPIKHEAYRVTMESLHNVVKHAQATQCVVTLTRKPGEYQVTVEDDGRGFDVAAVPLNRMGLSSMRERVAQLGGRFELSSVPGQGTTVSASFPASSSESPF
jgi:PAS domain S-box-containing protein